MPNSRQPNSCLFSLGVLLALAAPAALPGQAQTAQTAPPPPANTAPIGRTQAQEVQVSGDVRLRNGEMQLGNGSTITAGANAIPITLTRGGDLRLCATTSVHLARDRSIEAPDASGLMLGLDRGAIEAHYTTSKYSDVLLTPDLRILISGPGVADISIRVSRQGDTCIDNRGANGPYITVSSQLEGGVYRVQPGQHVSFQHGSLREVVDTEKEPCGCPQPVSVAAVAAPGGLAAAPASGTPSILPSGTTSGTVTPMNAATGNAIPGNPTPSNATAGNATPTEQAARVPLGGPSSTKADTEFPLAVSEGLTPPTIEPSAPVAAPGQAYAQVAVPFNYRSSAAASDGDAGGDSFAIPAPSAAAPAPVPSNMRNAAAPAPAAPKPPAAVPAAATPAPNILPQPAPQPPRPQAESGSRPRRFFRRVGHFFARVFGAEPAS